MLRMIGGFSRSEDGAVTVDWVVLTAAIVGFGLAVIVTLSFGAEGIGQRLGDFLTSAEIEPLDFRNQ